MYKMCTRKQKYRRWLLVLFLLLVLGSLGYIRYVYAGKIPDSLNISMDGEDSFEMELPSFTSWESTAEEVSVQSGNIRSEVMGTYEVRVSFLGLVTLKTVEVNVTERASVYLGGEPIGLYLQTDGVLVIDTGEVTDASGQIHDPSGSLVHPGDYIVKINDVPVSSKDQLVFLVQKYGKQPIRLQVLRDEKTVDMQISAVCDEEGEYKLGIWVRDDTQGIGTLTFLTEEGVFGALGHGISDADTGELLSSRLGTIYKADIWGIIKGTAGSPGGLCGMIHYEESNELGVILKNSVNGIYGNANETMLSEYRNQSVEIGYKQEIKTGEALIYTNITGTPDYYEINILEINYNEDSGYKGLVIEVTDEELLNLTGGIIQGMSGSPILQNGRLIGAVTHVFVKDPSKGYGIFIEHMLEH